MKTLATALSALLLVLSGPDAAAETWQIDAAHSHVGFKVRHMMVSWTRGEFGGVSGTIEYDPKSPAATKADVTIDVATIDTRDEKRDAHLESADFFDAAKHPTMTFKSRAVRDVRKDGFDLVGDLTLHGVTKEVVLKVTELSAPVKSPWGMSVVGARAEAVIKRDDFGMTWNKTLDAGGLVVGNEVHVVLEVEAMKK